MAPSQEAGSPSGFWAWISKPGPLPLGQELVVNLKIANREVGREPAQTKAQEARREGLIGSSPLQNYPRPNFTWKESCTIVTGEGLDPWAITLSSDLLSLAPGF